MPLCTAEFYLYLFEFGFTVMIRVPEPSKWLLGAHHLVLSDQEVRRFRYVQRRQHVNDHPHAAGQVKLRVVQEIPKHVRVEDAGHDK